MLQGFVAGSLMLVCSGYSREDVKECSEQPERPGRPVTGGKSVFTPEALADEICRLSDPRHGREATALLRQEYLGFILSHRRTAIRFPELRRLRRQPGFLRRLDQSVVSARSCALHPEEREVLFERLMAGLDSTSGDPSQQRRLPTALQSEILLLAALWEGWLEDQGVHDSVSVLKKASQILSARGLPPGLTFGQGRIWLNEAPEAVEAEFISELSRRVPLEPFAAPQAGGLGTAMHAAEIERWHTIQDSCESLGDRIVEEIRRGIEPSRIVVLIPDSDPSLRLALRRVLGERGIAELDPRDPLGSRLGEGYKRGLAHLELAASRFERQRLVSWLCHEAGIDASGIAAIESALARAGLRRGYGPVRGRIPAASLAALGRLEALSRRRLTIAELSQAHLSELRRGPGTAVSEVMPGWWERFWDEFASDLSALGIARERMALVLWMERIRSRLEQTPAPPAALRPSTGIRIVRASQANPGLRDLQVYFLGIPAQWLSVGQAGARAADLFLRARDREVLGAEFAVRSGAGVREARIRALQSWIEAARGLSLLEHRFEADGSERESVELLLAGLVGGDGAGFRIHEKGAHGRLVGSYALVREARSREVRLPGLGDSRISATDLDQMSRCPFLGLVQGRWKVTSLEEPDLELWPTTNGNLLHAAAEKLTRSLAAPGGDSLDGLQLEAACDACWKEAWDETLAAGRLEGWVPSPQLERQIARRAAGLLRAYAEAEIQYRRRSGAGLLATEEQARFEWRMESRGRQVTIRGKADRIDEHPQGIFVVDYKSGKQELRGADVREKGYRLQLPFYAIAAQQAFSRQVLGVQFIELTREARRSVGLFPKSLNGKAAGSLTQVRSNNPSLFDGDPGELWAGMEQMLRETVTRHLDGIHDAQPLMGARECADCRARAVCGQARREWVEGEE